MKKGIEVWTSYDSAGHWMLNVQKSKGHFTLDELVSIAREWEEDFYVLIINATYTEDEPFAGDFVQLYRAEELFKRADV